MFVAPELITVRAQIILLEHSFDSFECGHKNCANEKDFEGAPEGVHCFAHAISPIARMATVITNRDTKQRMLSVLKRLIIIIFILSNVAHCGQ